MKTYGWYKKMHNEAKDSPEYKACMEELIKEEKILSELRGFIAIGADNWVVYLNINSIESIYKDEKTARCIVTTNSGETFMPTETPIEIMEQINKAKSAYQVPPMQAIKNILENMKDLDPDFSKTVDEHFDELIDSKPD